jgi:polar amino acid transport system substrate-binding protein
MPGVGLKPISSSLAFALICTALACGHAAGAALKLCYEDVPMPPWTTPQGAGLNLELLRQVEHQLGEHFEYSPKPWKRCLEELRAGRMDGIVGSADAPARRQFSLPPLLPDGRANPELALYQDGANVFIRVGSGASWDGKNLVNPRGEIVAQRDYLVATVLREHGHRVRDTTKTAEEALRMLAADVLDVAVLQGDVAQDLVRADPRFRGKIMEAKTPYLVLSFYLMVGRDVIARDPKRIEAIWNAIGSVRASPEYRALEAHATRRAPPG